MSQKLALRALSIFLAGGALLAAALGAVYLARDRGAQVSSTASAEKPLAEPGSVPIGGPFTLVDHTGSTVTEKDYRGKYLLVFFGFTHCPDVCPTTLYEIAQTLDRLGDKAQAVQPLFISVDPVRDTPETLAEYVKAFHPKIIGLTGTKAQIDKAVGAYRAFYEMRNPSENEVAPTRKQRTTKPGGDYLVSHTSYTYLMSPQAQYLSHFSYGTTPEQMAKTIQKAIAAFGLPEVGDT